MASIPTSQARPLFTQMLVGVYREKVKPSAFLRSFFKNVEAPTRYVSIEVERGTEKVAVDILRGSDGNRNRISRSTEKIIDPPYFNEFFDITELDLYDRLFASTTIDTKVFNALLERIAEKLSMLQAKIERAYELQCSQVLTTGIVTVADGTNIDYLRKAGSKVNNSGTPWTTATVDPYLQIAAGGDFLRQTGKAEGGVLNAIVGSAAMAAFINNPLVQRRGPLSNINFDSLRAPQRNSVGAVLFGQITANSYIVNLWSYPEFYDTAQGVSTPYIDPKIAILLPDNPNFLMSFAAVPQLIDEQNPTVKTGAFVFYDFRDERKKTHDYGVESAGVAIPLAVDQIYTMQVVA